jgi:large subunit ribosomal protein L31
MKAKIHPKYYNDAVVTCACGNTFTTGSTMPKITVDICSACHPFFTGEMKFVDRQGRVEKFKQKVQVAQKDYKSKKQRKMDKNRPAEDNSPKSLREMIQDQRKQAKPSK